MELGKESDCWICNHGLGVLPERLVLDLEAGKFGCVIRCLVWKGLFGSGGF